MTKQYIILRKDAPTVTGRPVSPQKLAVMAAHASMVFLSRQDKDTYDWLAGPFTKILREARSLHALEKAVKLAEQYGLVENKDFFCIRDDCCTELLPDE